jgi:undecaprenyl-diphosphatase
VNNRIKSLLKLLTLEVIVVTLLLAISLSIFGFIADEVVLANNNTFDTLVFNLIAPYLSDGFFRTMRTITFFGSGEFLLPAYLILIGYFLYRKRVRYVIDITFVGISSTALELALKSGFQRNRPDLPLIEKLNTYSFPSGHAFSSFIFCSLIIYLIWDGKLKTGYKWLFSVLLILFSITIGVSRIVLRVHYATDIIAGFFLGIAWMIMSLWSLNRVYSLYRKRVI